MITLAPLTIFKDLPRYAGLYDFLPKKDRVTDYHVFKLENDGAFVGVFSVQNLKRNKECIARLYIIPKYRRQWAARGILQRMKKTCFDLGYDTIIADTKNPAMERMFTRFFGAKKYAELGVHKWYYLANREKNNGQK